MMLIDLIYQLKMPCDSLCLSLGQVAGLKERGAGFCATDAYDYASSL